ncbi:alpha/beta-hydrolase [Cristinia sonorae]|uniref:sn-1-specific diacylglycerol lipase n=1 Tax=Cristinia sonorae TaxID=1940300 RepID=A0A8K0UF02_9AGAR|nr:alpha/beta-hydrolase [Cristinia sonorae]
MISNLDEYGRIGVDVASSATALGFAAVKTGTRFSFRIARNFVSNAAQLGGDVVDRTLLGGSSDAGHVAHDKVAHAFDAIESLALAPILVGECVASTGLVAVASSLSTLQTIFPDRNEASFSLRSFVKLAHREWHQPAGVDGLPMDRFCAGTVTKGLVGWVTLQGMTNKWQEEQWFKALREIHHGEERGPKLSPHEAPQVHVTTDVIYPNHSGQIITADIGQTSLVLDNVAPQRRHARMKFSELKAPLRRYSQLVLAGYGGASLMFFGAPLKPHANNTEEAREEASLIGAVNAAEKEEAAAAAKDNAPPHAPSESYSWWNVLMGRHDDEIFSHAVKSQQGASHDGHDLHDNPPPATFHKGSDDLIPRFWVLTDHSRHEVVLVLRGTMSLNELAVDLTCEPAEYIINSSSDRPTSFRSYPEEADLGEVDEEVDGGSVPHHTRHEHRRRHRASEEEQKFEVHSGMLKMARAMGAKGKPVHIAVRNALRRNHGYNLVIAGHSLGAGVAGMLALMWADPRTCLTHRHSGFPLNRHVSAYCYAPPCLTDAALSKLTAQSGLITSFVYSHDVVARLSLGSIRDLQRACTWLCQAEKDGHGDGYSGIAKHALKLKAGLGDVGSEEWFLAVRKTLEANMHMTHLFPPGRVFWAMRDADLHPSHRKHHGCGDKDVLRLFEVLEVEKVFTQIIFAKDMLSSHWPHQYDRILHELV